MLRYLASLLMLLCCLSQARADVSPWKGQWIWNDTPRNDCWFRKVVVSEGSLSQAKIAITADNEFELLVNGEKVGSNSDWTSLQSYDITRWMRQGRNVIAVKARDGDAVVGGLLAECALVYTDGRVSVFGSDRTWKLGLAEEPGWTGLDFDDSGWKTPRELGNPPAGPWGGIDYPALAPKTPLEVMAVAWPQKANPSDTFSVTCKVRPKQVIPVDSAVGLRVLSGDETVCEQWMTPDLPASEWKAGETRSLTFRNFRLPVYVPKGTFRAQVVTTATDSQGSVEVRIGPEAKPAVAPKVSISDLAVRRVNMPGGAGLQIEAKVSGAADHGFLFALYRGGEMVFAADMPNEKAYVLLPADLPAAVYTARLLPHRAACVKSPEVTITIPGPETSSRKPLGCGTFVDRDGVPHRWYINPQGALIWDGEPCIPVGAMYLSRFFMDFSTTDTAHNEWAFQDDLERLRAMKQAGVTDLYLNPCNRWRDKPAWVWQRFADMCEEMGFNYGLQVSNQVKPLKAWHIAQDEYVVRIRSGETANANVTSTFCGKTGPENAMLYAAFDENTGELVDCGKAKVSPAGKGVEAEATPKTDARRALSVHFIPEYTFDGDMHDYWSAINDAYRHELDSFFGSLRLGPGFRLFIDPLDNEQSFREMNRMLPHSPEFRAMFAQWLESKYRTTADLGRAWAISDFDGDSSVAARLVPLGKASSGSDTGYALDEATGRTYRVDLVKSAMWYDMLRFRDSSIAEFNNQVADMIKKHHNAPVVLKATDTDSFVNSRASGGFDGLGMEAYTSAPELVRGCGGGVYARCKQSNRTMWTLVTETGLGEDYVGYPDPVRMVRELGSMAEMNAKGVFYFLLCPGGGRPGEGWYIFNLFEDPRQLWWMGAFSRMMKNSPKLAGYEPEVDYYFPGALAGQQDGFGPAKPAFHSDIPSQSVAAEGGRWVVTTSTRIPPDARRVIVNLEDLPATAIYGRELEEALKTRQVIVVGHRNDRGALSIDHYYGDSFTKDSDGTEVQALTPTATSTIFARTDDGTVYGLTDGNLTLYSKSGWIEAIRKMAGKPEDADFYRDVLELDVIDLGRAFQGMSFGSATYLWNLKDNDYTLSLDVPADAKNVKVRLADGTEHAAGPGQTFPLPLPAKAEKPVVIEGLKDVRIGGIDKANLAAAVQDWATAQDRAKALGMEASVMPPSDDWRAIYNAADKLLTKAEDNYRTTTAVRVSGVKVDGDLAEWSEIEPIYLTTEVRTDFAAPAAYEGAKLYTGWDESYIYVCGEVDDEAIANNYRHSGIWNGDAVEVFIDLYPDKDPGQRDYNSDCFQFLFSPTSLDGTPAMCVVGPGCPPNSTPKSSLWAVKRTAAGWQFEAAISRADINDYPLEPGKKIGFTVQLDDSDGGDRISARLWRGGKDASRNRLTFGRLTLGE